MRGEVCGKCNKEKYNARHNVQHIIHNRPTKRIKKWNDLGHSQRNTRLHQVQNVINYLGVSIDSLKKSRISGREAVKVSTSIRKQVNSIQTTFLGNSFLVD
jgi:flagellar biosynthesis chaperone FliJ